MLSTLLAGTDPGMWLKFSVAVGLICFVLLVVWIYLPSHKQSAEQASRLPLRDE